MTPDISLLDLQALKRRSTKRLAQIMRLRECIEDPGYTMLSEHAHQMVIASQKETEELLALIETEINKRMESLKCQRKRTINPPQQP